MTKIPGLPEGVAEGVSLCTGADAEAEGATEGVAGGSVRTGSRVPFTRAHGVVSGSPPMEEWLSACAAAKSVPPVRAASRTASRTNWPVGIVRRLALWTPPQRSRPIARDQRDVPPMRAILGWRKNARTVSCATRQATYPIGMAASPAGVERVMVVTTPVRN